MSEIRNVAQLALSMQHAQTQQQIQIGVLNKLQSIQAQQGEAVLALIQTSVPQNTIISADKIDVYV